MILSNASGTFQAGQSVLLYQAKGATINQSNSSQFGTILDLGSAGFFEENEIKTVDEDTVWLRYALLHDYDPNAGLQLISFPKWHGPVFIGSIEAMAWDGYMGGILAVQVEGQATLLQSINVNGMGFGDGLPWEVNSNCTFLTIANDYYYPTANWRGAPKGEGIAEFISGKEHGRGPQANGGGGGNDHNSGGGGGGNAGEGGQGGRQSPPGTFGCYGNFPGLGGKGLPIDSARIFFGGEGGNGHVDDYNAGSPGARGGGIAILRFDTLHAAGQTIAANGLTPPLAKGDGAGGGGGGGSIFLDAGLLTGTLHLEARGGDGGDVENTSDRCFGPGGGGGGGTIVAPDLPNIIALVNGGSAGMNTKPSGQCSTPENGASAGLAGRVDMLFTIPHSTEELTPFQILAQPASQTACPGDTATFNFEVAGIFLDFQWQRRQNGAWVDVVGAQQRTLSILASDNDTFRCVVSGPCIPTTYSEEAMIHVTPLPIAWFDVVPQMGGEYLFQNSSQNQDAVLWLFGDGSTSTLDDPVHLFDQPGTYEVTLIASNTCGADTFTTTIAFYPAPVAAFSAQPAMGCAPLSVFFENLSTGDSLTYEWSFEGGQPATSSEKNPQVVFAEPGSFSVTLVVNNPFGSDTLYLPDAVEVHPLPFADFNFEIDSLTVSFIDLSVGAVQWHWDFGDGNSSTLPHPQHTYAQPGAYQVTLAVTNGPCGSAVSTTILVMPSGVQDVLPNAPTLRVYPMPANDHLQVEIEDPWLLPLSLTLYDAGGQRSRHFVMKDKTLRIDMSGLPPGMYLLRCCGKDRCSTFKVLIL